MPDWDEIERSAESAVGRISENLAEVFEKLVGNTARRLARDYDIHYYEALELLMHQLDTESVYASLKRGDPQYGVEIRFHMPRWIR